VRDQGQSDRYPQLQVNYIDHHNPDLFLFDSDGEEVQRIDLTRLRTLKNIHKLFTMLGFKETCRDANHDCVTWAKQGQWCAPRRDTLARSSVAAAAATHARALRPEPAASRGSRGSHAVSQRCPLVAASPPEHTPSRRRVTAGAHALAAPLVASRRRPSPLVASRQLSSPLVGW
jgi:hypothetical protein